MWRIVTRIADGIARVLRWLASVFGFGGASPALAIFAVKPGSGWPGTIVTIDGQAFADSLDDNQVEIGGDAALVMRASPNRLTVIVGEAAKSGAIRITTGGVTTTASQTFQIRPWPELRDSASSGPPVLFHGP